MIYVCDNSYTVITAIGWDIVTSTRYSVQEGTFRYESEFVALIYSLFRYSIAVLSIRSIPDNESDLVIWTKMSGSSPVPSSMGM